MLDTVYQAVVANRGMCCNRAEAFTHQPGLTHSISPYSNKPFPNFLHDMLLMLTSSRSGEVIRNTRVSNPKYVRWCLMPGQCFSHPALHLFICQPFNIRRTF